VKHRLPLAAIALMLALVPELGGQPLRLVQTSLPALAKRAEPASAARAENPVVKFAPKTPDANASTLTSPTPGDKQSPSAQLWGRMETLLAQLEYQQIPILGALLAEHLHKHPDPAVYQSIADLLSQSNVSLEIKAILLDLLAETATPEALTQLLNLSAQQLDSSLYILVLQAIARIGDNRWNGQFHEELSPALENAWANPVTDDPNYLDAIGKAIASVGAPEGVEELLQTVSGNNQSKEAETIHRVKQEVAFEAISQVRNPAAVEVLDERLTQEPIGTPAFEASGNALAQMGSPDATRKILDWAEDAPPEGGRNVKDWLSNINDENSLNLIADAQNKSFKSQEIQTVIGQAAASNETNAALSATSIRP